MRLTSWIRRLLPFSNRRPAGTDRELEEELRFHLEEQIQTNLDAGMSQDRARRAAHLRLGNTALIREDTTAIWRWASRESLQQDVRLAARRLLNQRGFSLLAIGVLALGTGANTVVFSAANAVLFKPIPAVDQDGLVWVYFGSGQNLPFPIYRDYREAATTMSSLAAFDSLPLSIRIDAGSELAQVGIVSGNYFTTLGVRPMRGRTILPGDEGAEQSQAVAVISNAFWLRRLDGDTRVVGRSITVNGRQFVVVGVAPPNFRGTGAPVQDDLWVPVLSAGISRDAVQMIGRLTRRATADQAAAEFDALRERISQPGSGRRRGARATVTEADGPHPLVVDSVSPYVVIPVALMALVLLMACFNLASLLLARLSSRTREIGMRMALGAGRGRVIRQLLTEGALLTIVGAAAGLGIALLGARWLGAQTVAISLNGPFPSTLALDTGFDWRVLVYTGLGTVVSVLTFALVPTLQTTRTDVLPALRRETLSSGSSRLSSMRSVLITAQLAVSVLLLTATALLLQSWRNAATTDVGFESGGVLAVRVDPELRGYTREEGRRFYDALVSRLDTLPGAMAATVVEVVPLTGLGRFTVLVEPDQPDPPPEERIPGSPRTVGVNSVATGYFETLGIPLLTGRDFRQTDRPESPPVIIVNETLAGQFWPGENPLGRRLRRPTGLLAPEAHVEVVGVVADAKYRTVGESQPAFAYLPMTQFYSPFGTVLVKSPGDPMTMLPPMRQLLEDLDPDMATTSAAKMSELTRISLLPVTIAGLMVGTMGVLVLVLAAIGVAGVLSYLVIQRTREIGLRMALGASVRSVATLVVAQSLRWVAVGLALGIAGSLVLSRFITVLLYDIEPHDPVAFGSAALALLLVGGLASLIPARHAIRTDTMTALRAE
jgi:predicted permease